jgi:DNA-binding transcriptional MerR regulator
MVSAQPRQGSGHVIPVQRTPGAGQVEYRIDDLARAAGTTVRNVRAYQDRGLLPRPDRRGRANVYGEQHLERLRLIAQLLDRGHTLAGIKELLDAWESGAGLGGVLGLAREVSGPWSDESPTEITRGELIAAFGGSENPDAIAFAVEQGVLEPLDPDQTVFRVPSPRQLGVAAELYSLGVPFEAIIAHQRELRPMVEGIAHRFVMFAATHLFADYAGHALTDEDAAQLLGIVRRLRPLAQGVFQAELARAMRQEAVALFDAAVAGAIGANGTPDQRCPARDALRRALTEG